MIMSTRMLLVVALFFSSFLVLGGLNAPPASAAPCSTPVVSKVACENDQAGTPDWQVQGPDDTIAGYTTDISTTPGSHVTFKIKTTAPAYQVDIYRLGYYRGAGARLVGTVKRLTSQSQPTCLSEPAIAFTDCGNWADSVSWNVPSNAVSGLYYARLHRNDTGAENEIAFVVRDDSSTSKILFQTSDSTWQAYNRYGGTSLYFGDGPGQGGSSFKASYNRPLEGGGEENFIFNAEYPTLRFLEANGYDVSYTTDLDSARRGNLIKNHRMFMAVGHDEYWSNEQRVNVEAARDAGVHMAFLTGNEIFWKTRWAKSIDASATDWRTIICYKETKTNGQTLDNSTDWTGTWRDPRFSPPADGGRPENALLGNIFMVNGRRDDSLQVPSAFGKMRLWRNTPLATMASGSTYSFQPGTLGYEWNAVVDNGFQPAGVAQLSRTTVNVDGFYLLKNHGDLYGSGPETHALTLYKAPSGALVFGAGTVQWAWGLDDEHAFQTDVPTSDVRMKQATVNLLGDMGVQPQTLQAGLVTGLPSTDTAAPVATFSSVPATSTVGVPYTFSGTVNDASGKVGGVEVSSDSGATWHPANWTAGTTTWSYTYTPSASGAAALRVRAVDDSANLSAPVSASPMVGSRACPCGIWTNAATPAEPDLADGGPLELGVKWRSNSTGYVRGVKFYKGVGNTGTHTGSLWSSTGQQLATGTFTGETSSGWQTLTFPSPVAVSANTTYVVSYYSPSGHYAADTEYFSRKSTYLEPLTALQTGTDGLNGVYKSGAGFPSQSAQDTNYWIDVVWAQDPGPDTRPPALLSTSPMNNAGTVALTGPVSAVFDERVSPASVQYTLTGPAGAVTGTPSVSSDGLTVTFTPAQALAANTKYTASLRVSDSAGNALPAAAGWAFTTGKIRAAACPCTIWDDFARPTNEVSNDPSPVEVGTKVRFDGKGEVLGVRFYKGLTNTGTHTGSLWSSTGLLLGTGTFTGETSTGWQTLTFSTPIVVQANTTYVVSYYAPNGQYSADGGYFANGGADYGPVHALANNGSGGNGVYRYGSAGGFPTSTYNAGNYWVDAIFRNGLNGDSTPPTSTAHTPATNSTGVSLTGQLTATFSEPVDPASAQIWLADPGGAKLTGTVTLSADQKTVTWTPSAPLAPATQYTANVRIADINGNAMTNPVLWALTTQTSPVCPCSLFSKATVPTVSSADDTGAYELGVRFTASSSGKISGVRFYKGAENTGTHTGSLWSATGQRLATGTFTGETVEGWQTLTFPSPVTISAGVSYTASYTTTTGHYSVDNGYFQRTGVNSPPLSATATAEGSPNGVFQPGSGFPTSSYQGGNYWVDVVYNPNSDTTAPAVTATTPQHEATNVALNSPISTSFNEPVDLTSAQFSVVDPGGAKLAGTLSISSDQKTVIWTAAARFAAGTTYTANMRIADVNGNLMGSTYTWSFTPVETQTCPCTLFSGATMPTVASTDDGGAYELGVRFTSSANGKIAGVKFYKGQGNTGTHTGSLWSVTGERLATGTFTGETASGWQTLTFAVPVTITAGTAYIASYTTTTGHYSSDAGYFQTTPVSSPPLSAAATSGDTPNGVYQPGSGFPASTYGGTNYWVDAIFTTD
jgi:methionine-rich copper-binding protein CopC